MHLGNGAITPECGLVALGIAAAGVGVSLAAERKLGFDRARARTAGALTAAVFAAQAFNLPILPYSSAHLVGGVLLAWVLGPALGVLCMTVVLSLQAVLLGDGGLLALGANVLNMGLVPAGGVWLVDRYLLGGKPHEGRPANLALLGATAFTATLAGAGLIALEVTLGRGAAQLEGWSTFAAAVLAAHVAAGALEAALTVGVVLLWQATHKPQGAPLTFSWRQSLGIAAASLALALAGWPQLGLASSAPDGYEAALLALRHTGQALGSIEWAGDAAGVAGVLPVAEPVIVLLGTLLAGISAAACVWCGRAHANLS